MSDERLRVFVSSTLGELADEREAARRAVTRLHLATGMFGVADAHVFLGIYWQRWDDDIEDEYDLSGDKPKLIYIKAPAPDREENLTALLDRIRDDDRVSYRPFRSAEELEDLIADDLAVMLTEGFETAAGRAPETADAARPEAGLPQPFTALVGRDDEVEDVLNLLGRNGVRLVTLTGPGGVGKSRVAIEVAHEAGELFSDGVTFVSLGGLRDAGLVIAAIANALHVREAPDRTPLEAVIDHLRERRTLLVLDNCEHVLAAGPRISELLAACPGLRVLATSRAILRLRGEHDVEIHPLSEDEAVRLFVDRAEQVSPNLRLTADAERAIVEVCRRLDGLPLAIELAAARTRMLTPAALLARLTSRLGLLTGGPRDLPERQQTLRAALDWDYDLLDGEERTLFRRLAIFDGGCTFEAAEAIAAAGGGLSVDVADGIESLVSKSLLHRDHSAWDPRFGMLQTVREYAFERLDESGERALAEEAHAAHYAGLVATLAEEIVGPNGRKAMVRIDADRANIRAALAHAAASGDVVTEVELCARLAPYWLARAAFAEARQAVESALAHSVGHAIPDRVRVLLAAAVLARAANDFDTARRYVAEATAEAEATGNKPGLARAFRERGAIAYDEGDLDAAVEATKRSHDLSVEVGDDDLVARALNNLAVFAYMRGDYAEAGARYAASLAPFARAGDQVGIARALMNLGRLHLSTGDIAQAKAFSERALAMWWALRDEWDATDSLDDVAMVALATGDAVKAAEVFAASQAMRDRLGARLPLSELPENERRTSAIAAALDPETYEAARERGARLDFEGVVRLALGDIPPNTVLDLTDIVVR